MLLSTGLSLFAANGATFTQQLTEGSGEKPCMGPVTHTDSPGCVARKAMAQALQAERDVANVNGQLTGQAKGNKNMMQCVGPLLQCTGVNIRGGGLVVGGSWNPHGAWEGVDMDGRLEQAGMVEANDKLLLSISPVSPLPQLGGENPRCSVCRNALKV